jgi:hypothetical protein
VPGTALAADPTKVQCVEANEKAQALRQEESLLAARASLTVCLAAACPGPVRQDCAELMAEVDRAMPTVVFEVLDRAGQEVHGVSLLVDGTLEPRALDGAPVEMDPGTHEIVFTAKAGTRITETIVVHEGEKDRRVIARATERELGGLPLSGRTISGLTMAGLGVVGITTGAVLGLVAKSTYDAASCHDNPGNCTTAGASEISTAHGQAAASTVSFIVGGALLAGGVTLWATGRSRVQVAASGSGAVVALGGAF